MNRTYPRRTYHLRTYPLIIVMILMQALICNASKAMQSKTAPAIASAPTSAPAPAPTSAPTDAVQGKTAIAQAPTSADVVRSKGPVADTVIIQRDPAVDSTLVGLSVYDLINNGQGGGEAEIFLNRSESVDYAFKKYIEQNAQKKLNGFRIRIFFDNKQSARAQSEEVEKIFIETFPQYPVYRTYTNPYFKVAVGDFRTKSDAMKVLQVIQRYFPKAFIIKDIINYPL